MPSMNGLLAITAHTGIRLAEVGLLLIIFAGVWMVVAEIPQLQLRAARTIVGGAALAAAGVFLIVATHWGHFG